MPRYTVHFLDEPNPSNPEGRFKRYVKAQGEQSAVAKVVKEWPRVRVIRVDHGWEELSAGEQLGLLDVVPVPSTRESGWGTGDIEQDWQNRHGEASAERRYTDKGASNFAMKPGRRRYD